jgi:phospholipase C
VVDSGRRQFLQLGAGAATLGALPSSIARALALPAGGRSGTIEDVEHVVIFMQENRSFDHYFGHLRGVRGYNDRFPVLRADGRPIWTQPRQDVATEAVLPFHLTTQLTSAQCVLDLDHSWYRTHAALAGGRNDQWPLHKTDMTMGYYTREDLPFHYALADAFTVCDHYFCSTPNQTHPNRMYLMTGTTDPTGAGGGPLMDNNDQVDKPFAKKVLPAFTYTTYPERLQAAGISWQVYQQGTSVEDSYNGNFGTNVLGNFKSFIEAPEGSPLHARGMSKRTLEDLAADVKADRLPQVSWLLPPAAYSEHPKWTPGYGAAYMSRVLDALTANPDVWAKTALFVMYDENDGYFDHVPPPQPPTPALPGKSTISVAGEVHDVVNPLNADRYHADNLPYGLGPRVPMMVISPWSKGGFVCSQVFDHTSVLMFLERRFGVMEPNITAWRRSVCGDLTSALDFKSPNARLAPLPDTSGYIKAVDESCHLTAPAVPAKSLGEDVGEQEAGVRPARPLPYTLAVEELVGPAGGFSFLFRNDGAAGASFYVYREHSEELPRRYTVEAGKCLQDNWATPEESVSVFTIAGPNGFTRRYQHTSASPLIVGAMQQANYETIILELRNVSNLPITAHVTDNVYGRPPRRTIIGPGQTRRLTWPLHTSGGWYDVSVALPMLKGFERRLAGHLETGRPSISDPAARQVVLESPLQKASLAAVIA